MNPVLQHPVTPLRDVPRSIPRPEYVGRPGPRRYEGSDVQTPDVIERMREASAIGSEATVAAAIRSFLARTQADELIVAASIYDHGARLRSLALTMAAAGVHVAV